MSSMNPARKGAHAIVIGGSMAGLLAARALSEHFARVTILERDELPDEAANRAGVPQGRHTHALLLGGRQRIERLFPGLADELTAAGAPLLDQGWDTTLHLKTGYAPRIKSDVRFHTLSRPLIEARVRNRVRQIANVSVRERAEVVGLLTDASNKAVVGVRLRPRGRPDAHEESLLANLVVEASGRASRLPAWLVELGYAAPEVSVVNAFVGYASRYYRIPASPNLERKAAWIVVRPPHGTRGGLLIPVEGERWAVTLYGYGKDYAPTDEAEFMAFMRSLPSDEIYAALKDAEPISPIYGYRRLENRMVHYDRMAVRPEGLVVMGDAYCALNPSYGQGITLAAIGALALDEELQKDAGMTGFAARFQRRLAREVAPVWAQDTTEDARWPMTDGVKLDAPTRFMHWYLDQIFGMIPGDPVIFQAFMRVQHMLEPGTALFKPAILAKVIAFALANRGRRPAPAEQTAPAYGD